VRLEADHSIVAIDLKADYEMVSGKTVGDRVAPFNEYCTVGALVGKLKILKLPHRPKAIHICMDQGEESVSVDLLDEERWACDAG
jgi:hypothetical protein